MNNFKQNARLIPALTGFRGLAALMVFACHYIPEGKAAPGLWMVAYGSRGVDFFFVLSGYLFTRLYYDRFISAGPWELSGYFRKRLARILPPFLVVALLSYWLLPDLRTEIPGISFRMAKNLLLLQGYDRDSVALVPQGWTLTIEELFYATFPFIMFCCGTLARPHRGCRAGWAGIVLVLVGVGLLESLLWCKFLSFALGILLAVFCRDQRTAAWIMSRRIGFATAMAGSAFFLAMPLFWGRSPPAAYETVGWSAFGLTCLSALSGVCVLASLLADTPWRRWFGTAFAVFCGRISYCFYLVHMLILALLKEPVVNSLARFSGLGLNSKIVLVFGGSAVLAISALSAWLLHSLIEEPCRQFLLGGFRRIRRISDAVPDIEPEATVASMGND